MGRGKKVYIGDIEFSTQGEAKDYVRELLLEIESIGHVDSGSEYWQFFSDLLARHSDYDEKRGLGIGKFIIGRNTNNDIELRLERVDGSPCDVSWIKCVTGKATSVISNLKAAMRVHVDYQITKFKDANFYTGVGCAICLVSIEDVEKCHVDHEIHFDTLAEEFISNGPAYPVAFADQPITNKAMFHPQDSKYADLWFKFHQEHAKLRLTHSGCNLRRKKAVKGV